MKVPVHKFSLGLLFILLFTPLLAQEESPVRQHLFYIERSKNSNIVQYDAQVGPDGKLLKKDPVIAYWIRHNEQGQEQKLNWLQRNFAYGFDAKLDKNRETADLRMKADVGRDIMVVREGDTYRATLLIDGELAYFEKMYIDASRHGLSLNVRFVDLYGEDVKTGEARFEKFIP